jgi:tetratricopeptide (TPR) repeat protein
MMQNNLGLIYQELGIRTAGEESAQLLAQAVEAHRMALTVYTREHLPQQWAMTQNNLGNALQNQGTRTSGEAGVRLLAEAVEAYRQALTMRTREQLPQDWATTQNNLGNALQNQGNRTSGEAGVRLLAEAVEAYRQALVVRTREQLPIQWAATQNNLGSALQHQGIRMGDEAGIRLLLDAVETYRQALTVRTRDQLPQDWAATQNNLGAALQELGTRADDDTAGADLLSQAVAAYRKALQVYTREHLPQSWAMTQNNLGNALKAQGIRMDGDEGVKLLTEAEAVYRKALEVRTPEALPKQWAETLQNLSQLYHEVVFNFPEAFALNQQLLNRHIDDLSAQCDFAEKHFTTGRFAECEQRIAALLANSQVEPSEKTALCAIAVANLLTLDKRKQVPTQLDTLQTTIASQPDSFKVGWSFEGTKHFISQNEKLAPYHAWLLQLVQALEIKEGREAILAELQEVREKFKTAAGR